MAFGQVGQWGALVGGDACGHFSVWAAAGAFPATAASPFWLQLLPGSIPLLGASSCQVAQCLGSHTPPLYASSLRKHLPAIVHCLLSSLLCLSCVEITPTLDFFG